METKMASCIFFLIFSLAEIEASWGDQSPHFKHCVSKCHGVNCSTQSTLAEWEESRSFGETVVGWTCREECEYECMWSTVHVYGEHGRVPQFYGKWPFKRIFGIQEPASVFASFLNLFSNIYMLRRFVISAPRNLYMYQVWCFYGLTAINAWLWSIVFHTKDRVWTERLDYFSALATVLSSFFVFCLRVFGDAPFKRTAIASAFLAFYSNHVYHMAFVHFDYGYNMKVNITVGVANGLGWLCWFLLHKKDGGHITLGILTVISLGLSVPLEVFDFPPILWTLDTHAIWHFLTVPLPFLWFNFALEDTRLLAKLVHLKEKS